MRKIFEQDEQLSSEDLNMGVKKLRDCLDKPYIEFIKALTGKQPNESTLADVDPKVRAVLNMGKKDLNLEDEVVKVNLSAVFPVKQLHPTQSQIGLLDSIGWPAFNDPTNAVNPLKGSAKFVKDGSEERILTANGKWILDGHHRWSQTFLLNPNSTIQCVDITLSVENPQQLLKVIQLAIAAAYGKIYMKAANAKTDIFSDSIVNENGGLRGLLVNIFKGKFGLPKGGSSDNIGKFFKIVYENMPEDRKSEGGESQEKKIVIDYLADNARLLKKMNQKYTKSAPQRIYMPQPGDTRKESGISGENIAGIPAEVINKLKSGNLNFKKALTAAQSKKAETVQERKFLKTFEQFKNRNKK